MGSALALRPATADDEPFLLSLYGTTRADELALVPWSAEQKEAFLAQQFAAQSGQYAQHHPGLDAAVVLLDDVPGGRLLVARSVDAIRIVDISLLPEFRGRGTGTELLRMLLDEAAAGGKRVDLHVEQHNPARRLYERLGFRRVGEDGPYLRMEWTPSRLS